MSRVVWFAVGTATGTYATLRARRAVAELTPAALSDRFVALGAGLRVFAAEVRKGMADREQEIWRSIEAAELSSPAQLSAVRARDVA